MLDSNAKITDICHKISFLASLLVLLIGLMVLIGWIFDITFLKSLLTDYIITKPNAALTFIFCGSALLLLHIQKRNIFLTAVLHGCTFFIALISLATLLEYVLGYSFGIDNLLFRESPSAGIPYPGRISIATAIIFLIISVNLFFLSWRRQAIISQILAAITGFYGFFILLGMTYHYSTSYSASVYAYASVYAACAFISIFIAIIFLTPTDGGMRVFLSRTPAGKMFRRIIPVVVIIFTVTGYLRLIGGYGGFFDLESGITFLVSTFLFVFLVLFTYVAMKLKNDEENLMNINKELSIALQKVEKSNKELQQFAYIASHDLQEPLRMVSSFTDLLERRYKDKLDQDAKDFIHFANDGAKRMQQLISELLTFSRVQTQGEKFHPIDTNIIFKNALENLQMTIDEKKAVITVDQLPVVNGDTVQLTRVFQNLLHNAMKFCKKIPVIHVGVKEEEKYWVFSVSDNGIGIPKEEFEHIFVVFNRIHSKAEYAGTGMGLAICKRIIERHNGNIWLTSTVDEGSTFYFSIEK